ncbi:MAG TPA: hypothetical protein VLS53_02455 [Candidatus Dormibacteraeota bacterium]|nr:hypothetical protein [Candidatus Dormibacteraeota bacterium]
MRRSLRDARAARMRGEVSDARTGRLRREMRREVRDVGGLRDLALVTSGRLAADDALTSALS